MEQFLNMPSMFNGLDWDMNMSPSFQPTPASMNAAVTPSPMNPQLPTPPSAGSDLKDKLSTSVVKFQVCSSCRRKKRKCSLDRPSCSLCLENGWTCEYRCMKKKPGPTKRSVATAVVVHPAFVSMVPGQILNTISLPSASHLPIISDETKNKLIELYFIHIQPVLPMFCRKSFERDLAEGRISNKLLYAFYAVSWRFLPSEEIHTAPESSSTTPWESLARTAEQLGQQDEANNKSVSLNDVKAQVLLTLYEINRFPCRKAWLMIGSLVRMAFAIGLHRIDCGVSDEVATEFELEERRFVWWAVWSLDSSINILTGSPFGVDSQSIGTALFSTSVAAFTAGVVGRTKLQFLPTDSSRSWKSAQELLASDTEDGMNMYLLAVCHLRTVNLCRQRLHANTTTELTRQFIVLGNTLSCMRLSLPEWYFNPSRHSGVETPRLHRARLVTLLIMYLSHVQCILAHQIDNREDNIEHDVVSKWKMSVATCEDIAAIFRHWKPEYFVGVDPFIGAIIWYTISMLTLHTMSIHGQSEEGPDVRILNALDLLNLALESLARHWQFAHHLLDSVKHLQTWNWLTIDLSEVLSLFSQVRIPMNPLKQEAGAIDMWQIIGNIEGVAGEAIDQGQGAE